jgi:hypothetical protein
MASASYVSQRLKNNTYYLPIISKDGELLNAPILFSDTLAANLITLTFAIAAAFKYILKLSDFICRLTASFSYNDSAGYWSWFAE